MKKIVSLIFCLCCSLFALTGCSAASHLDPDNPVTLSIWHVYGSQTESPLNDVINTFNRTTGKEKGVIINVASVSNSSSIDEALIASANGDPGSVPLPDLFTAYPRIAEEIGTDRLLDWSDYLSQKELELYVDDFLQEGYLEDDRLLMIPIAKSTEVLYLNQTIFDRFAAETGVDEKDLLDFDRLLAVCDQYYDWSDGQTMFQINDFYHYFLAGIESLGGEFIVDGKINGESEDFERLYTPVAQAAIYGGLCVEDGYASDRWKTAEVIANVGSTAGVLYLRDYVTYEDNTTENIEISILPYPCFKDAGPSVVQRGGGLFAIKSDDEQKNEAAALFASWIAETDHNLDFTTNAGYLPVTKEAFDTLFEHTGDVAEAKYSLVYDAVSQMRGDYTFIALPLYDGAGDVQASFETLLKTTFSAAHEEFEQRAAAGEKKDALMKEITARTLAEIRTALK